MAPVHAGPRPTKTAASHVEGRVQTPFIIELPPSGQTPEEVGHRLHRKAGHPV
jgi:hypothetical protein